MYTCKFFYFLATEYILFKQHAIKDEIRQLKFCLGNGLAVFYFTK